METEKIQDSKNLGFRWFYLVAGVVILIFLGLIYAWSIFVTPLENEFGWQRSQTQLTFSITMMMFCIGGLISGIICSRKTPKISMLICAVLLFAGFLLSSRVNSLPGIYVSYGVFCGLGVGFGYNATISSFIKWFPDKQGLVSGILLMGFGFGSMILGTLGTKMMESVGWRKTFIIFAIAFGIIMLIGAVIIKIPTAEFIQKLATANKKTVAGKDYHFSEMMKTKNFWLFFCWAIVLSAAGLSIIGSGATYAVYKGFSLTTAAFIAGLISIFNGGGRVIFGFMFDNIGYKKTMLIDVCLFIATGFVLILTTKTDSMALLVAAYAMTGLSFGGVTPTISAFTGSFFGNKNYPLNFSIMNMNLIISSYLGPYLAGVLQTSSGGEYFTTFACLIVFGVLALLFTCGIKKEANQVSN